MAYASRSGKKPMELASKSAHSHVINDAEVKAYLAQCWVPNDVEDVKLKEDEMHEVGKGPNPITHVIAIDGGITEVPVKKSFPSSTITFFQFGVNMFALQDLDDLGTQKFIAPEAMAKLKDIERFKLVLPTKNVSLKGNKNLVESVRRTLSDFFLAKRDDKGSTFGESLQWFLFEEYTGNPLATIEATSCPHCKHPKPPIERSKLDKYQRVRCVNCRGELYLIDVFRLHEAIDNELGAGGIVGYVTNLIEQLILVHYIRFIHQLQPDKLKSILFLKDGPLAFFGQTANMHAPMRKLCMFMEQKHDLFLAGLTKSGPFVEHLIELTMDPDKFPRGRYIIPDNKYIYSYIQPGDPANAPPFGSSSYYSCNIFYRSTDGGMHVVTLPSAHQKIVNAPEPKDFKNIDAVLQCIGKLKCDMYDSALLPIALVNKLVSLSNHPSAVILSKFATGSMK
jgi:hypothetical protein